MCTFAAEMVMHGCFIRARKGNQVRILSSTRYCHPHYGKSHQPLNYREGGLFGESQETCHVRHKGSEGLGNRAERKI